MLLQQFDGNRTRNNQAQKKQAQQDKASTHGPVTFVKFLFEQEGAHLLRQLQQILEILCRKVGRQYSQSMCAFSSQPGQRSSSERGSDAEHKDRRDERHPLTYVVSLECVEVLETAIA